MTEEFVRGMFRAIDGRDWEALGRHLHPDLRYERPGFAPLDGREAVLGFYRDTRQIQGEHRIEAVVIAHGQGAHFGRFVGAKNDGTPVDVQYADYYRFADGLLHYRRSYFFTSLGI